MVVIYQFNTVTHNLPKDIRYIERKSTERDCRLGTPLKEKSSRVLNLSYANLPTKGGKHSLTV